MKISCNQACAAKKNQKEQEQEQKGEQEGERGRRKEESAQIGRNEKKKRKR